MLAVVSLAVTLPGKESMRFGMSSRTSGLGLVLGLSMVLGACAGGGRQIPPMTPEPTGVYHVGKFVWYDLLTHNVPKVEQFYGTLFGWEFEEGYGDSANFTLITYRGLPIGGIAFVDTLPGGVSRARWVPSLSVPDVDEAVETSLAAGGVVYFEPEDVGQRGRIAVVGDPQGAVVAFVRSAGGDPSDIEPLDGGWLWTELWTRDLAAATSFYSSLVGYEVEVVDSSVLQDYTVLRRDGRARAGVRQLPWEEVMPNWLPYVRVTDPKAIADRVESLGGRVLIAPADTVRAGSVALIADPAGGVFAVQKWPVTEDERSW
jgi:predicted enzyme related to lactoylglutathione lyase